MTGRSVLAGSAALTIGTVLQAVLGIGAQLVLMRLLLPADFGEFALVWAMGGLVQMVLSLRLNCLIIRVPDGAMTDELRDRYRAALVWETAAALLCMLAWLLAAGPLTSSSLALVAALALGQWCNQHVAFFERQMAYGRIVLVESGSQILGHLLAVGLVLAGAGAATFYARELAVALMRLAGFARIGALSMPLVRWLPWAQWRLLFVEARGLWLDGMLEGGLGRLVVLGASAVGGAHGAGIFAQSQRLAVIPHQLLAPAAIRLAANLFSRTADPVARRALLWRRMLWMLAGLLPAAALAVLLAEPLIPPVLGEHWRPATQVVVAMAGVIIFFPAFELVRNYCMTQHRMRLLLAARLSQYAVFAAALVVAPLAADPVMALGGALSATYGIAFGIAALGLLRRG